MYNTSLISTSGLPFILSIFKGTPGTLSRDKFMQWLSGFVDGEGNFQVIIDRGRLCFMFRIRLHIDDIGVLYTIQKYLGVGTVNASANTAVYTVRSLNDLLTVIIPLFTQYPLHTTK